MSELDPRWVVRGAIRVWIDDTFPEPPGYELEDVRKGEPGPIDVFMCGDLRGTHSGARKHYRNGGRPCDPCRIAANEAQADRHRVKNRKCVDCDTPITRQATRCAGCNQRHRWTSPLEVAV